MPAMRVVGQFVLMNSLSRNNVPRKTFRHKPVPTRVVSLYGTDGSYPLLWPGLLMNYFRHSLVPSSGTGHPSQLSQH